MKFAGSTRSAFGRMLCCAVFALLMIVNVAQGDIVIKDDTNYSQNNMDYQLKDKAEGYIITTGGQTTGNSLTVGAAWWT